MPDFPTTLVPTDVAAPTTALGNVSKNHTDHHQAVDERLGELQAGLGKFTATGYDSGLGPLPTFFDPAMNAWDDGTGMWIQFGYFTDTVATGFADLTWGIGQHANNYIGAVENSSGVRDSDFGYFAESDDGAKYAQFSGVMGVAVDGLSGGKIDLDVVTDGVHRWRLRINDAEGTYQLMKAAVGQTDPILDLQDSTTLSILSVAPDGKVGGVAPSDGWSIKWNAGLGQWVAAA